MFHFPTKLALAFVFMFFLNHYLISYQFEDSFLSSEDESWVFITSTMECEIIAKLEDISLNSGKNLAIYDGFTNADYFKVFIDIYGSSLAKDGGYIVVNNRSDKYHLIELDERVYDGDIIPLDEDGLYSFTRHHYFHSPSSNYTVEHHMDTYYIQIDRTAPNIKIDPYYFVSDDFHNLNESDNYKGYYDAEKDIFYSNHFKFPWSVDLENEKEGCGLGKVIYNIAGEGSVEITDYQEGEIREIIIENAEEKEYIINFELFDNLGNMSSESVTLIIDKSPPVLDENHDPLLLNQPPSYIDTPENNKFSTKGVYRQFIDEPLLNIGIGSTTQYHSQLDISSGSEVFESYNEGAVENQKITLINSFVGYDNDVEGKALVSNDDRLSGLFYDVKYKWTISDVTDYLGNRNMKNDTESTEFPLNFGRTRPPILNSDGFNFSKGNITVPLQLGKLYDDEIIGLETIVLSLEDREGLVTTIEYEIGSGDMDLEEVYQYLNGELVSSDRVRNFQLTFNLPDDFAPAKEIPLAVYGTYLNGNDSSSELKGSTYSYDIPNTPLAPQINDIELTITNSQGVSYDILTMANESVSDNAWEEPFIYYFVDNKEPSGQETGYTLSLNPTKDVDYDSLSLVLDDGEFSSVEDGKVIHHGGVGFSSLKVRETYNESGSLISNDYIFPVEMVPDNTLDGYIWESHLDYDDEGDTLFWQVSFEEDFSDVSGLQAIGVSLNDTSLVSDYSDQGESFSFGDGDFAGMTFNGSFSLSPFDEDKDFILTLTLSDWAGNRDTLKKEFHYDNTNPEPLISSQREEGIYLVNCDGIVSSGSSENDLRYSFYDDNQITVKLDLSQFTEGEYEDCTITPSLISEDYSLMARINGGESLVMDTSLLGSDGEAYLLVRYIGGEARIPSNEPIRFSLTFSDRAGNIVDQNYLLYTPQFLSGSFSDYVLLDEDTQYYNESNEIGEETTIHYFDFEKVPDHGDFDILRLDSEKGDVLLVSSEDRTVYRDTHDVAHFYAEYQLHGRNGSGYSYPSRISEAFEGKNNIPHMVLASSHNRATLDEEHSILGPNSAWSYAIFDPDGDSFTLNAYLREGADLVDLDSGGSLVTLSSLLWDDENDSSVVNYLVNGENYTLYLFAEDSWESQLSGYESRPFDGNATEGADHCLFTYDDEAPTLVFDYEKVFPYEYIYGDIQLNIADNLAGEHEITIDSETSDNLESAITLEESPHEDYTHRITSIPDGSYGGTVYLNLTDEVGNRNQVFIGPFRKDSIAPVLNGVELNNPSFTTGPYYFKEGEVPLSLSWSDETSGVYSVAYRFVLDDEIALSGETSVRDSEKGEATWNILCSGSGLPSLDDENNNKSYGLEIELYDRAGNESEWISLSEDIVFDSTAPHIRIDSLTGITSYSGIYYLKRENEIALDISLTEINPSPESYTYRITTSENEVYTDSELGNLINHSQISEGEVYDLSVGTSDLAGNWGWSSPVSLIIDETAPLLDKESLIYTGQASSFYSGAQFRFTLEGEKDLERFFVFIGQEESGVFSPSLSELITGHLPDGSVEYNYHSDTIYNINLPEGESGEYRFRVYGVDHAGNVGEVGEMSFILTLDNSQSRVVVKDSLVYSNNSHVLSAYWSYQEGKEEADEGRETINGYYYRIYGDSESGFVPLTEKIYTAEKSANYFFDEPLTNGEIYCFEVQAIFDSGRSSNRGYSSGTFIDLKPPQIESLSIPTYSTLNALSVDWDASDKETSIDRVEAFLKFYEYDTEGNLLYHEKEIEGHIVKTPSMSEVGPFILDSRGDGTNVVILSVEEVAPLDIADGESVFVTLRFTDVAGNISESCAGVCIKDDSAPPVPIIIDWGDYLNPLYNSLTFDWTPSSEDLESGTAHYAYQLLVDGAELGESWIPLSKSTHILTKELGEASTLTFSNGASVKLALKVTNGAGLSTIGYSNGIILDTSKPEIPIVQLGLFDGDNGFVALDYLLDDDINLTISSQDYESHISGYVYDPVIYSEGDWFSLGHELWIDGMDASAEQLTIPTVEEGLEDYNVLYYRATAYNNTGDPSPMAGISNGAVNYRDVSLFVNGVSHALNGTVFVTWDVVENIPLAEISLSLEPLFGSSFSQLERTLEGTLNSYRFTDIPDGYYRTILACKGKYGSTSHEFTTNTVIVDSEAPFISDFTYDKYVYHSLDYSFAMDDVLSGVSGYRYRLGTVGQPDLLTGGWLEEKTSASLITRSLSIEEDLAGGIDGLYSSDGVILSVQVQDRCGNWSAISYSDPIIVDKTAPKTPTVTMNNTLDIDQALTGYDKESYTRDGSYILSSTAIENLIINSVDEESGLKGYYWALREAGSDTEIKWNSSLVLFEEGSSGKGYIETDIHREESLQMWEGSEYQVCIVTENQVGLKSNMGVSELMLTDFEAPSFEVDSDNSGVGYEEGTILMNGSDRVALKNVSEESDILILDYSWENSRSETVREGRLYFFGKESFDTLGVPFEPADETDYGNYNLSLRLTDSGGYSSSTTQSVRFNAPPVVTRSELTTNPMRPLEWDVWSDVYDVDGLSEVSLAIRDFEDNLVDEVNLSSGTKYTFELGHPESTPYAQESAYTLTLTCLDNYGQSSESDVTLTVKNTSEGSLYTHEFWSDEHWLTGLVTVPEALSLTVGNSTAILMSLTNEDDPPGLLIKEGASLSHEGEALYEWGSTQSGYWQGLIIQGEASLNNLTIREAKRGIVLDTDSTIIVSEVSFKENQIGLHLLGISPTIRGCSFEDNLYYAIKEDWECEPLLINNTFTGNGYDYYDSELTVRDDR